MASDDEPRFTLKSFFSPAIVKRLAADLVRAEPTFASRAFVTRATKGLDRLELLDRGKHIAAALAAHLPADYPRAIDILLRSLGPTHTKDENTGHGMAPFFYLPHTQFVVAHGLEHFDVSMRANHELTKRFTAEFSMRPFIDRDPERTFAVLRGWARDPDAHVRRLVSECTRPRLPWAMRVPWLDANLTRVVELLALLRDDTSTMVRRSVANNLNDISKLDAKLASDTCRAWLAGSDAPEMRALVEHALRSAVKRGDADALGVLGFGRSSSVRVENVRFSPARVAIGRRVKMTFDLVSTARTVQRLNVDTAVHFVKADKTTRPKVFKLRRVELAPRGRLALETSYSLAVHTTRKPRPGIHAVDVIVNGIAVSAGSFHVIAR
ncbi:MAG: DNA alkylation repair protein [Kofleriaceae bacterium]